MLIRSDPVRRVGWQELLQDVDDDEDGHFHGRLLHSSSSTYIRPAQSFDINPPNWVEPNADSSGPDDDDGPEDLIRFEWQHMLNNVLQGDVLKSEKTRLSTANLSTTTSLANGIGGFSGGGTSGRRQRAYAIWLLVRAKIRGRTAEEESRYLEEARAKVDEVLTEVIQFRVTELAEEGGGPALSEIVKTNNAGVQVSSLLKRVDWCESLYPSRKALALEKERVTEGNVVVRLEALRTWQQITRRIRVTIGILQKWTGSDWEKLSSATWKEAPTVVPPGEQRGFVAGIVREDSLQTTFEKRLLSDLYSLVHAAKQAMIDYSVDFAEMNLPGFSADLLRLAVFPSRLAQEALRTVLESVAHVSDPSVILIEKLTGDLRKGLEVACELKRQYIELADGDTVPGWSLPERVEDYEETLLATLRFFFKLLHWKLKSPSKAIYFKETEIVENEWVFLSRVTEEIEGGDSLVGEHFSTLTHRLLLRVMSYFDAQLQVLETRDMTVTEMLRWFSQTLDNVRARHRKLLRFSRTMLTRFENSAEYVLDNIDLTAFINGLVATDHFMIYTGTFERDGIYMIGDPSLHERPHLVRHILSRCFSNDTQMDATPQEEEPMHYILLLSPRDPFIWTGRVMNLEVPKMEFDLRDKRVRLVSDGPALRLIRSKQTFVDLFPAFERNILIEHKAHLARVSREIKKIGRAVFRLSETIIGSVERVKAVSRRTPGQGQELVGSYFNFAADLGQRSVKYLEPAVRSRYVLLLMKFAISWIAFICDDCVPTDPRTFKWAVNALEFAMVITRGDNILKFSSDEFALLRAKVASCMTLLISHFDILGARSSSEARKEQDRIDAARIEMKHQLELKFASLRAEGQPLPLTREATAEQDDALRIGWARSSVGSLRDAWDRRMEALAELDQGRMEIDSGNRMVGRVLDQEKFEDRSLAFLASSQSNISMRWQQGKFIGGGTFGQVYLAVNLDSGEELAVKEIRFQDLTSAPHLVKTIRDEMKVMEMLRHDNIVQYYGIEVHRDKVYIFEEYCSGGSLANLLEHGRIEDEIVIQVYALQMLSGLIYLHAENVVHRDIKPDNILLDSQGTIKYVDFGAAKVLAKNQKTLASRSRVPGAPSKGPDGVPGAPEANSLTGTPMYLSPETVKGERRGKMGAMDVWAVGCVILECATGKRPWSNLDNEWAIMFTIGIAEQHPPLPSEQELSPLGIDFIRQCLDIDPEKRPTAADLMNHPWIMDAKAQIEGFGYEEDVSLAPASRGGSLGTNSSFSTVALLTEEEEEEGAYEEGQYVEGEGEGEQQYEYRDGNDGQDGDYPEEGDAADYETLAEGPEVSARGEFAPQHPQHDASLTALQEEEED